MRKLRRYVSRRDNAPPECLLAHRRVYLFDLSRVALIAMSCFDLLFVQLDSAELGFTVVVVGPERKIER